MAAYDIVTNAWGIPAARNALMRSNAPGRHGALSVREEATCVTSTCIAGAFSRTPRGNTTKKLGWIRRHSTSRRLATRASIYKARRFSDHAPLTIDYDYEL